MRTLSSPESPDLALLNLQQVEPSSSAREAALSVLQWARQNHLFSRVPMEESAEAAIEDVSMEPPQMFSARAAEGVLRRRAINLVGFNERDRAVVVFTRSRITATERKLLPFHVHGNIKIEYIQGGLAQVRGNPPPPESHFPYFEHNGRYCCGSSIFPANCLGAGTLGLLGRDYSGKLYGVTNNHVGGACNNAQPGLPILAPGPGDVSSDHREPFTLGRHSRLLPINDGIPENIDITANRDASCFELLNADRVTSMQGNRYDTPGTVADPQPGMQVEKIGRTTGHTTGTIVAQAASPVPVNYVVNEYSVRKTVFFAEVLVILSEHGPFSKPGDSGSLVVHTDGAGNRHAVGLVFAGDVDRSISFMLPLRPILTKLGLELVQSHNV